MPLMPTVSELIETINTIGIEVDEVLNLNDDLRIEIQTALKALAWIVFVGIYHGTRKCAALRWSTADVESIQEGAAREAVSISFQIEDVYGAIDLVRKQLSAIKPSGPRSKHGLVDGKVELLLRKLEADRFALKDEFNEFICCLRRRAETVRESDVPDYAHYVKSYDDEFFRLKTMIGSWVRD